MRRTSVLGALVAAMLLWAAPARADYICEVYVLTSSNYTATLGNAGGFFISYYSGPDCTGSYLKSITYCSTGATSAGCGIASQCNGVDWLFSQAALYNLMNMAQQAMLNNAAVFVSPCSVSTNKGGTIDFLAN
jgi:hypothetical protein